MSGIRRARKKRERRGSQQVFGVKRGVSWHKPLARAQCMAGRRVHEPLDTEKPLGAKVKLSGAAEEDGTETRSEAEGKIETDFLAGVEIIEGQMI